MIIIKFKKTYIHILEKLIFLQQDDIIAETTKKRLTIKLQKKYNGLKRLIESYEII